MKLTQSSRNGTVQPRRSINNTHDYPFPIRHRIFIRDLASSCRTRSRDIPNSFPTSSNVRLPVLAKDPVRYLATVALRCVAPCVNALLLARVDESSVTGQQHGSPPGESTTWHRYQNGSHADNQTSRRHVSAPGFPLR